MKFFKATIRDVPLEHKTVLVRADYNVPLDKEGKISDDLRIRASIPTLQYLIDRGCKVVIMSHLGRPEGKPNEDYSLQVVAERLANLLGRSVRFVEDCKGDRVRQAVKLAPKNAVVLLENVRFYAEEEANDYDFAKQIADAVRADYFVQDGFGVVHRAHASTDAITLRIPAVAGLLLEREYTTISAAMAEPKRPLVAIMGGAKVSDKIAVIERFVEVADTILIGGAMANTFLNYKGVKVGASKYEDGQSDVLDAIYAAARKKVGDDNVDQFIQLPSDVATATEIRDDAERTVKTIHMVQKDDMILDIGDETIERYTQILAGAQTVVWNGPVGYSEVQAFAHGSARIALELAKHPETTSIVGGGDTADFVLKWDAREGESFTHVSTGGGAGLDLMAGKKLPGVERLLDAH